ncbi:MAG TPA: DUF2231 domain-containing protein [Anaeromyxobacter sp.]
MESKAKAFGHPVHPMLVVFPLGLFATSLVFDVIRLGGGGESFSVSAFYMIAAGIIGGLAAAVFGLVDYLAIPRGTRAKTIGAVHGLANLVIVGLYVASWGIRYGAPERAGGGPVLLSGIAVLLALVSGWLGGELVDRLGVGVDDGAHVNAPSSLSGRPAGERWTPPRPLEPKRA